MPKGPQGQKRPADVIGNAVHVMRIATGEIEEYQERTEPKKKSVKASHSAQNRKKVARENPSR